MIINCTPHPVSIIKKLSNGHTMLKKLFEPAEVPVRLAVQTVRKGEMEGVPLSHTVFGEPQNLPEQRKGVLLIVSQLVKNSCPWRRDLVVPAEVIRDNRGNVIGCESLGL